MKLLYIIIQICLVQLLSAQTKLYYPPANTWMTKTAAEVKFNQDKLQAAISFAREKNQKTRATWRSHTIRVLAGSRSVMELVRLQSEVRLPALSLRMDISLPVGASRIE